MAQEKIKTYINAGLTPQEIEWHKNWYEGKIPDTKSFKYIIWFKDDEGWDNLVADTWEEVQEKLTWFPDNYYTFVTGKPLTEPQE